MSGKVAPPAETPRPAPPKGGGGRGPRPSRLYVLSRGPISSLVRRAFSVAALVVLDVVGLAFGIYLALVIREVVTGDGDVLWGLLWREGPAEWLKFAAPITVLVFAQAGLYRQRELRPGAGRILACLIVVALIVLAFGLGTGYDFSTSGLIPTSVVVSAVTIGLLRAAYESATLELMRAAGFRRRVVLVGAGESLVRLRSSLESARNGLTYEFVGVVAPETVPGFRLLGQRAQLAEVLIELAIKLDSRGPILFVDRRIGVGEREFGMLKFRTMVADAPGLQPELEEENEAGGALFKIRDDPRVTRVGRFLRRFSLDEIPQVVNVLKGEMSLVGPRPLPLRDYQLLEDWHRRRYAVLPGMTGLWQISGRSGLTFDDLVRLDFTYLENWSIWLDISIIVKTIPAVITRRGAY